MAAVVVAGVGGTALAGHIVADVKSYTGCLNSSGELRKIKEGDAPRSPCTGTQVLAHFSAGDITSIVAGAGLTGGAQNGTATLAIDTSYALPQGCMSGQVAKWNDGGWACETDEGAGPAAFVALRSDNPIVPPTTTFTELVTLRLPPGRYQVFGKVGLHNRDPGNSFRTQCALVPSNEDGTPREPGELGSDWSFLHLARTGLPGEEGGFSLIVSQELAQPGTVVLGCDGYGNQFGAFANYGSIRAIEVAAINASAP